MLVTAPLVGFSFQGDERSVIYHHVGVTGSNPLRAAEAVVRNVDNYVAMGNFRPVSRSLEPLLYGLEFDAAEATGLAPDVVHGGVMLIMVAILAVTGARAVAALARSADTPCSAAMLVFPMALAATLVANGISSPLVLFPFTFIGSVVLILAIALAVARDRDMTVRPLRRGEMAAMALLGVVAACTYDLVYVAPVLAAVFIAARAWAAAMPAQALLATAATRRWLALSVGFLTVFLPVRLVIALRCSRVTCYEGSDISVSGQVLQLAAERSITGAPPAGWANNFGLTSPSGDAGTPVLTVHPLLLAVGVAAVCAAIALGARSLASPASAASSGPDPGAAARQWRLAGALAAFGTAATILAAVMAALAARTQRVRLPIGEAGRDTLLTQVGWSLVITAAALGALASARSPRATRLAIYAAAAILGAGMALTLWANTRIAAHDSADPLSVISHQVSAAASDFDTAATGAQLRCDLIRGFGGGTGSFADARLHIRVNALTLARRGQPFCDFSDGAHPFRFVDVSPQEWWFGHVARLAQLEITSGCRSDPPYFCPYFPVSHSHAEAFLTRAFPDPVASSSLAEARRDCRLEQTCASVTRGQMATALSLAAGLEIAAPRGALGVFDDLGSNEAHYQAVEGLAAAGVLTGTECAERRFCPDLRIRRWVLAVWMVRILDGGDDQARGLVPASR